MHYKQRAKLAISLIVFVAWATGSANLLSAHESAHQSATAPAGQTLPNPASEQTSGWSCPMHPEVHQHDPGRCPICKMQLTRDGNGSD